MNANKIIIWDIETTDLSANHGVILCICAKEVGKKKVHTWRLDDGSAKNWRMSEQAMLKSAYEFLSDAAVWVTHYGARFDVPFVNARLLYHGKDSLPPVPHVDTWRVSRYQLKLNANRLQTLTEFFGGEDKTRLNGIRSMEAFAGDRRKMNEIVKHCKIDVEVLENVYLKLRPVIKAHPNVAIGCFPPHEGEHCPACGSAKLQKRGFRIARTGRAQRYHCQNCGHWSSGSTHKFTNRGVETAR